MKIKSIEIFSTSPIKHPTRINDKPIVFGLGDDNKVYIWDLRSGNWLLHHNPNYKE